MTPNSQLPAGESTALLSSQHRQARSSGGKDSSSSSPGLWLTYAVAALAGIAVVTMAG
ncbi:hypothetical protein LPJ56_004748, partial [Coemansia sp. RSA 2599]